MKIRVKELFLLLCLGIMIPPLSAQIEFSVADEIKQIRQRYYSLQEEMGELQVRDFGEHGKAYIKDENVVRLSKSSWQGTADYYFTVQGKLYFIFEQNAGQENRYYFTTQLGCPTDTNLPTLIRWQDSAGQIMDRGQEDVQLLTVGLEKTSMAVQALATAKLYQAYPGVECRLLELNKDKVDQDVVRIRTQAHKECERIDRTTMEDRLELGCVDQTSRYCIPGTEMTRWEVTEEGCDPGCVMTSFTEQYVFYDEDGTVRYREDIQLTNIFGMAEYSPYEQNSERYFIKTRSYYQNGELFYQEQQHGLNEQVLQVGSPLIDWTLLE